LQACVICDISIQPFVKGFSDSTVYSENCEGSLGENFRFEVSVSDRSELFLQVVRHIGEYLEQDVSHLKPDSSLEGAVPGLDSLRIFELMLYLEECFGIALDQATLGDVKTMNDVLDRIEQATVAKVLQT
jgi:acyl carrier protein